MKKYYIILPVLSLLYFLISSGQVSAQDFWHKTNGPFGGSVYAVAGGIARNVYAGAEMKGIFKSTDSGQTWAGSGLEGLTITSIYIDPSHRIFATLEGAGLFRSVDAGVVWTELTFGNSSVQQLVNSTTGRLFAATLNGVFASDDNGVSWPMFSDDLPENTQVFSLAAASDTMIFAGTNTGVYRSDNNGNDWTAFNNLLSSTLITSLAVDSNNFIFAGSYEKGMFFSSDSGKSWTARNSGIGNYKIEKVLIDSANHIFIAVNDFNAGGIYKSTNLGLTWTKISPAASTRYPLDIDLSNEDIIYCGTMDIGILQSLDMGATWNETNTGLSNSHISSLLFISDTVLIAGHTGGISKSSDFGITWVNRNSGLDRRWVNCLVKSNTALIYAGTENGIYVSEDNAETWELKNTGLTNLNIRSLSVDKDGKILAGTQNGVFRLDTPAGSWQFLDLPGLTINSIFAVDKNLILAGTTGFGVYRSVDNGQNWTNDNTGLTTQTVMDFEIISGVIYAATLGSGVMKSEDLGDSWTTSNSGLGNLYVKNIITDSQSRLYAGTDTGCYLSTNAGETWSVENSGFESTYLNTFTTQSNGHVFAGTLFDGVYYSTVPIIYNIESTPVQYYEGTDLQFLTDSLSISDIDSKNMSRAEIWIYENFEPSEDSLFFENTDLITGSFDSRTGLMTLAGFDSRKNYEQAIRSVQYMNKNSLHLTDTSRMISYTVYDSTLASNLLTREILLIRINEPPALLSLPDIEFKANESDTLFTADYITDADHEQAQLELTARVLDFQRPGQRTKLNNTNRDIDDLNIVIDNLNKIVYFSATPDSGGIFTVQLKVTDPDNASAADTITVSIERIPVYINNPPYVLNAVPDFSFNEDSGPRIVVNNIRTVIVDPDPGDSLSFYLEWENENLDAEIIDYKIVVNAAENYFGTGTFTLTASDTSGESASDVFSVTVLPVNDPPVVSAIPQIIFEEDESTSLTLNNFVSDIDDPIDDISWFIDFPSNIPQLIQDFFTTKGMPGKVNVKKEYAARKHDKEVDADAREDVNLFERIKHFEITFGPEDSLIIDLNDTTSVVTFSATPNFTHLNIPITFIAADLAFGQGSYTTSVSVLPVNDPPVCIGLPPVFINEDDSVYFYKSMWVDFLYDIDDPFDELEFSLRDTSAYINITLIDDSTALIKPVPNWFGSVSYDMKISDGIDSIFTTFNIVVRPVNDAPLFENVPDNITFADDSTAELYLWDMVFDIETVDSLLTFEFTASSDSLLFSYDTETGLLQLSSEGNFSGLVDLGMRVYDDSLAYADTTINIKIESTEIPFTPVTDYVLDQNYPNPFNPGTVISFAVPLDSEVLVQLFNVLGERVAVLYDGYAYKNSPAVELQFYGNGLPSGVYFYTIYAKSLDKTRNYYSVKKMLYLK